MFMDWKNQCSENEYITQSNLLIQCNPYQNTNGNFHRTRTISQFVWKHKRPQIAKAILRKNNGAWRINLHDFKLYTKLQPLRQHGTDTKIELRTNGKR